MSDGGCLRLLVFGVLGEYLLVGFVVTVVPQVTVLSPETPSFISTIESYYPKDNSNPRQ